jgi:hypothetical protein
MLGDRRPEAAASRPVVPLCSRVTAATNDELPLYSRKGSANG